MARIFSSTHLGAGGRLVFGRESGSAHSFGSTPLTLHILLSSWRDSWNVRFVGSEILARTYAHAVSARWGGGCLETHVTQVLDEPRQLLSFQALNTISIPTATKEDAELLVKLRRRFVEIVELLEGIGQDHEGVWLGRRLRSRMLNVERWTDAVRGGQESGKAKGRYLGARERWAPDATVGIQSDNRVADCLVTGAPQEF